MSDSASQRIVKFELLLSCVAVINGAMIVFWTELSSGDVAVGAAVALLTAALCAGADRSRLGLWVFGAVGVFVIAGLGSVIAGLVTVGTESWVFAVIPGGMVGLGVGWLLNRVLFGVVGSVPEARVERGFGWTR